MHILRVFLGHLPGHCGLFFFGFLYILLTRMQEWVFAGFPHTTSSSCSGASRDIDPDTGVVSFRVFSTGHVPRQRDFLFFRFSRHNIMQMLRYSLGHFSAFSSDTYSDMGVVFFRSFRRILRVMLWRIQLFPRPFTYTPGSHHWIWVLGPTIIFRLIQAM